MADTGFPCGDWPFVVSGRERDASGIQRTPGREQAGGQKPQEQAAERTAPEPVYPGGHPEIKNGGYRRMDAKVEVITKPIAEEYMKHNINNYRAIRNRKVDMYAKEMASGNWQANGEPIVFDEDGNLINGQHRLLAIIKANVAVTILVVRGVSRKVDVFDMGLNRRLTDIWDCRIGNNSYANQILSTTNLLMSSFNARYLTLHSEVLDYAEKHHELLLDAVRMAATTNGPLRKSPCMLAAYVHLSLNENIKDKLKAFFDIANSGYPKDGFECTPALLVRNYINKGNNFGSTSGKKALYIITYLAIVDFIKGNKRTVIYKTDNDMPIKKMEFVKFLEA